MSGARSRRKGCDQENAVRRLLRDALPDVEISPRNLDQYRRPGPDLIVGDIALEVKRAERLRLAQWIEQARRQAAPDQLPCLTYRQNRQPWTFLPVLTLQQFAAIVRLMA